MIGKAKYPLVESGTRGFQANLPCPHHNSLRLMDFYSGYFAHSISVNMHYVYIMDLAANPSISGPTELGWIAGVAVAEGGYWNM